MSVSQSIPGVRWRLTASEPPRVRRRCPGCRTERHFVSTDRFRVNANGHHLDVWLIYRCVVCDARWNRGVCSRVNPRTLDPSLYEQLVRNDAAVARRWAFDTAGLRALGVRVDGDVPVRIDVVGDSPPGGPLRVRIELADPLSVRLDRLLAQGFAVPRSRIWSWYREGTLRVVGGPRQPLRKAVQDGQIVERARGGERVIGILQQMLLDRGRPHD